MNKNKISIKLLFTVFFWGGAAIAAQLLLQNTSPGIATLCRFGVATLFLYFFVRIPNKKISISPKGHIKYFILGILGITICYFFYFIGLKHSTPFNAALFETTTPLLTYLLCMLLRRERFNGFKFIGIIIAYLGVAIVTCRGNINNLIKLDLNIGDLLLILSTISLSFYNILYKDYHENITETLETYYIFLYGVIGLIPWVLIEGINNGGFYFDINIVSICSVIFLAVGSSVLAYIFYNQSISEVGISNTTIYINMVPVITIILSVVVLRQIPHWSQVIGALIILIGMLVSNKKIS